jgi:hypothetical protein
MSQFSRPSYLRRIGVNSGCLNMTSAPLDDHPNSLRLWIPNTRDLTFLCFCPIAAHFQSVVFEFGARIQQIRWLFDALESVQQLSFFSNVTIIEREPFSHQISRLESITFELSSQLQCIGSHSFFGCQFREIILPRSLRILRESCFSACVSLTAVIFEHPSMLERIEEWAFSGCPLSEIQLPYSIQSIDQKAFDRKVWSVISFTAGNGRYRCRDDIFEDTQDHVLMYVLKNQKIFMVDSSIEVISDGCFVEELILQIPSRLRVVEFGALRESWFRLVSFPSSLIVIGRSAFAGAWIEEVRFEKNSKLERIEREAFHESKLRKMIIPRTVTHIGEYAFGRCWNPEIRLEKYSRLWRVPSWARQDLSIGECSVS